MGVDTEFGVTFPLLLGSTSLLLGDPGHDDELTSGLGLFGGAGDVDFLSAFSVAVDANSDAADRIVGEVIAGGGDEDEEHDFVLGAMG